MKVATGRPPRKATGAKPLGSQSAPRRHPETRVAHLIVSRYAGLMARGGRKEIEKEPLLVAVGTRIREIRTAKRIEPAEFARDAGFSLQYLWRLEDGQLNLTLKSLSRISIALDAPMSALLEGVPPDPGTVGPRPWRPRAKPAAPASAVEETGSAGDDAHPHDDPGGGPGRDDDMQE